MTVKESIELNATQVESYLREHPEFFNEHLHLLELMHIPHPSGNAVSLIAKQLEIFRAKHQELEGQLTQLIDIARENDISYVRMHKLTLALLDAKTLHEAISNLEMVLAKYFLTDFIAVRLIKNNGELTDDKLFVSADSDDLKLFSKELSTNEPSCGRPTLSQARVLFGENALEVKSFALVPMLFTEIEGFLAIGSMEDHRFHYSMGNLFLSQMAEIVGTRLISLLNS